MRKMATNKPELTNKPGTSEEYAELRIKRSAIYSSSGIFITFFCPPWNTNKPDSSVVDYIENVW